MWITKTSKRKEVIENFIKKNEEKIQWEQIFINNGYGIIYRKLIRVY